MDANQRTLKRQNAKTFPPTTQENPLQSLNPKILGEKKEMVRELENE